MEIAFQLLLQFLPLLTDRYISRLLEYSRAKGPQPFPDLLYISPERVADL